MKAYFLGRLDGGLGQSVRQPAHRADVVDTPVGAEDDSQHDRALDFVLTGVFGVFGFFTIENRRSQCFGHDGYIAARASSGTATGATPSPADAVTLAWPIAIIFTRPDSVPVAGAAGWRGVRRAVQHSDLPFHDWQRFRIDRDRRLNDERRVLNHRRFGVGRRWRNASAGPPQVIGSATAVRALRLGQTSAERSGP